MKEEQMKEEQMKEEQMKEEQKEVVLVCLRSRCASAHRATILIYEQRAIAYIYVHA